MDVERKLGEGAALHVYFRGGGWLYGVEGREVRVGSTPAEGVEGEGGADVGGRCAVSVQGRGGETGHALPRRRVVEERESGRRGTQSLPKHWRALAQVMREGGTADDHADAFGTVTAASNPGCVSTRQSRRPTTALTDSLPSPTHSGPCLAPSDLRRSQSLSPHASTHCALLCLRRRQHQRRPVQLRQPQRQQ